MRRTAGRFARPGRGSTPGRPVARWMPSAIQSTGRTVCVRYSKKLKGWVVGGDVATLSVWSDQYATFRNYGGGTGWTGTALQPYAHKSPSYCENGEREGLLSGSNGDGLIYTRGTTGVWSPADDSWHGEVNEGGAVDPRTAGHLLSLVDPDLDSRWFMAVLEPGVGSAGGAGRGIVRSLDEGITWSAWSMANDRNYTALIKSSLWNVMYATADDKGGGSGGVFVLTGLQSGTATVQQIDTVGTNNPGGITDCRGFPSTSNQRTVLAPSPPTGTTTANIPPPRYVSTVGEAAARIAGYCFGDGNPDHTDNPLGGTAISCINHTAAFITEIERCASVCGWTSGVQFRKTSTGTIHVLKSALCTALGIPATDDIYHHALTDHTPTRLQCQAFLASVIETEGQAGTAPSCKIMDDARGGEYDIRIDRLVQQLNFPSVGPGGSTRSGVSVRVALSNLDAYAIPLIVTGRYPGESLAPWPEPGAGAPPSGNPADYLYVYVGTGANAGVWEAVITKDRTTGALGTGDITWRRILTLSSGDEAQCGVAYQPSGVGTLPIQLYSFQINAASNSSGTYTLTASAGGAVRNYRKGALRTLNATVTPTPTWDTLGSTSVNMDMYGVPYSFPHPVTFMGEAAAENGRFLGSNWGGQDADISPDGSTIVVVGKTSPYRCDNPWATTPIFRPFSQGLGVLSGEWDVALGTVDGQMVVVDDDRGWYTFRDGWRHPILASAIGSDDVLGIPSSPNSCGSVERSVVTPTTMLIGHASGKGYASSSAFAVPPTAATVAKDFSATSATDLIGFYDLLDGASALRYLGVLVGAGIVRSAAGGGTPNTTVQAFTSSAPRTIMKRNGQYLWLCVPDKGIYRSSDYGATWSLWWSNAISGDGSRWFGFLAQDKSDPNILWATFDDPGVYRITSAHTAASSTARKVVGGDLDGTEQMGLVMVDELHGNVTAFRAINDDGEHARVYHLLNGTVTDGGSVWNGTWVEEVDEEITEGGQLVVAGISSGKRAGVAASGQGFLRRL